MTKKEEYNQEIGALVQDYVANEKKIAALRSDLDEMGEFLGKLAYWIRHDPEKITISQTGEMLFEVPNDAPSVLSAFLGGGPFSVSVAAIHEQIGDLQAALDKKSSLELRFEFENLDGLIKK